MAIGDTWETINTYSFVAGETIITADYENDVVNNLEYLYTHPSNGVNIYTGNTNTDVSVAASTNDVLAGLSFTFTPTQDKVLIIAYLDSDLDLGYKLNTGAITYIAQDKATTQTYMFTLSVTAASSNTVTMYLKNTAGGGANVLRRLTVAIIEMAN